MGRDIYKVVYLPDDISNLRIYPKIQISVTPLKVTADVDSMCNLYHRSALAYSMVMSNLEITQGQGQIELKYSCRSLSGQVVYSNYIDHQ